MYILAYLIEMQKGLDDPAATPRLLDSLEKDDCPPKLAAMLTLAEHIYVPPPPLHPVLPSHVMSTGASLNVDLLNTTQASQNVVSSVDFEIYDNESEYSELDSPETSTPTVTFAATNSAPESYTGDSCIAPTTTTPDIAVNRGYEPGTGLAQNPERGDRRGRGYGRGYERGRGRGYGRGRGRGYGRGAEYEHHHNYGRWYDQGYQYPYRGSTQRSADRFINQLYQSPQVPQHNLHSSFSQPYPDATSDEHSHPVTQRTLNAYSGDTISVENIHQREHGGQPTEFYDHEVLATPVDAGINNGRADAGINNGRADAGIINGRVDAGIVGRGQFETNMNVNCIDTQMSSYSSKAEYDASNYYSPQVQQQSNVNVIEDNRRNNPNANYCHSSQQYAPSFYDRRSNFQGVQRLPDSYNTDEMSDNDPRYHARPTSYETNSRIYQYQPNSNRESVRFVRDHHHQHRHRPGTLTMPSSFKRSTSHEHQTRKHGDVISASPSVAPTHLSSIPLTENAPYEALTTHAAPVEATVSATVTQSDVTGETPITVDRVENVRELVDVKLRVPADRKPMYRSAPFRRLSVYCTFCKTATHTVSKCRRWKTSICRHWYMHNCRFVNDVSKCPYAHGNTDLRSTFG
jgi:hypothetical protein